MSMLGWSCQCLDGHVNVGMDMSMLGWTCQCLDGHVNFSRDALQNWLKQQLVHHSFHYRDLHSLNYLLECQLSSLQSLLSTRMSIFNLWSLLSIPQQLRQLMELS